MEQIGQNLDLVRQPASGQLPALPDTLGVKYPLHPTPDKKTWRWMFDPAWFCEAFRRRWGWGLLIIIELAVVGGLWGALHSRHTASVCFVKEPNPPTHGGAEPLGQVLPRMPLPPVEQMLLSSDLLQRVAAKTAPRISPDALSGNLELLAGKEDILEIRISAANDQQATTLGHLYATEATRYLEELQAKETVRVDSFLAERLKAYDQSLEQANAELTAGVRDSGFVDLEKGLSLSLQQHQELTLRLDNLRIQKETLDLQITNLYKVIASHHPALLAAKQALDQALLRYTDEHPKVQELRTNMLAIEARVAAQSAQGDPEIALNSSSLAQSLYAKVIELRNERLSLEKQVEQVAGLKQNLEQKLVGLSEKQMAYLKAKSQYESLQKNRALLAAWQTQNQLLRHATPCGYRLTESAASASQRGLRQWSRSVLWAAGAGLLGLILSGMLIALVEVSDGRIRSAGELGRISRLPLLACLSDINKMTPEAQRAWGFQTLTTLMGALTRDSRESLMCGFISSQPGEGRSTWVHLLSEAASERGYRVVTLVCNRPCDITTPRDSNFTPSVTPVLLPHDITRTALAAELPPIVEIPFTAWAWNLNRRAQWQEALNQLRSMENLIVLIEFPAAAFAESVLLSENLSPLIWLCRKDAAQAADTARQLETLRNSRAPVVGTVFNDCAVKAEKGLFGRLGAAACLVGLLLVLCLTAGAAQPPTASPTAPPPREPVPAHIAAPTPTAPVTNTAPAPVIAPPAELPQNSAVPVLSASTTVNLADWQKHLTLGPGDILQVSMYGQPDSVRANLAIGPDGRLNYMQARDVVAAGLTIDELRDQLEKTLLKFYRPPLRVVVVPQAYRSKKYYLLGNVTTGGVYPLDRPVTIVEALANAGGFVSVVQRRASLSLVDLSRSFLIRREAPGQFRRMPVDFEGLFLKGDLQQNVPLAPEDYLYFSPQDVPELYVLGEVMTPGITPFSPGMSAIKAIAAQGGFTPRAWRQKILIVRGSLSKPATFIISGTEVLAARSKDFQLQPRDIIFVYRKPWARVEELLELAITDFMRAAVITYTGERIDPIITHPIVH